MSTADLPVKPRLLPCVDCGAMVPDVLANSGRHAPHYRERKLVNCVGREIQ